MSPSAANALSPDVLSVRGRRVHVKVADVWLLGVGFETISDPGGLGAGQEGVSDEDESYPNKVYNANQHLRLVYSFIHVLLV